MIMDNVSSICGKMWNFSSTYYHAPIWIVAGAYVSMFYLRRQIQGYYFDYKAVVSTPNLSGKTALITGGNSGIGLGSAIHLSKLNANVIIACRNQQKAAAAVQEIQQKTGNKNVSSMSLDLSELRSVEQCVNKLNETETDIDYLILNAGIYSSPSKPISKDGLSQVFQANYLGHWYLVQLLMDKLKRKGSPVRIVSVSSGAHSGANIPDDDTEWEAMVKNGCSYGQSKLLQIMHMRQLQKELDGYVKCVSVTPGMVRTNIFSGFNTILVVLYPLFWYLSRNIMTGAEVVLHACTNDQIVDGGYYSNCRLKETKGVDGMSNDPKKWKAVWDKTDDLIKSLKNNTFEG